MSSILRRQVLRTLSTVARTQVQALPARLTIAARSYASASSPSTAAAAVAASEPFKSNVSISSSALVSSTKDLIVNGHRIVAGAVVSRQPLIVRDLTPFEQEYFTYQKNLERENAAAFGAEFYFKKGSIAERRWKQQEAERQAAASGIFSSSSSPSKSASKTPADPAADVESEEDRVAALETKIEFNDRVTEADRKNDVRSLERALQRTLYLIVKKPRDQHAWQFPQGGVHLCENLQEAAGRELQEECGSNMDLWFVGRVPIGHYNYKLPKDYVPKIQNTSAIKGTKVFFMKAHIFAGQVQVDDKEIVDFAWVTKQEMKDYVSSDYYEATKDMLSDF
ncbi:54S ribosomal protein L17 mitochondrial [Mortierella polycephala]|uniref:Large ribosomal subunit protein mL46 n=1 Tax=Mortierella polycephala TaxID=41804 RepID=A0A9P6U2J1_9FUNG|nr:54S ribosomal protein L17 mitochondrial [Mortierella polycephala]